MNEGKSIDAKEAGKDDDEEDALLRIRVNIGKGDFATADSMIKEGGFPHETVVDAAMDALIFLGAGPGEHAKASEIIRHYEVPESTVDALVANDLASCYQFGQFNSELRLGDVDIQGERAARIRKSAGKLAFEEVLIRSKRNRRGVNPKQIIKGTGLGDQEVIDAAKEVYATLVKEAAKAEGKDLSRVHAVGIEALSELGGMENAVQKVKELGDNPLRRLAADAGILVNELRRGADNGRKNHASRIRA